MKITSRYLIAAMLAAAPLTAAAQTQAPPAQGQQQREHDGPRGEMRGRRGPGGPGGPGRNPVEGILRQRERLGLSAEQVTRLEAIQRDLQARNQPLHERLQALRPEGARPRGERADSAQRGERRRRGEPPRLTEEQRQQMQQRRQQAEPILQQLRQNRQAALEQARAVLTPRQREQVQQAMRRRDGRRGPDGQHGAEGRTREGRRQP